MDLTEEQLAVILQACIEFACELLGQDGGFLPFGARVKPDGEIEFVQLARDGAESLDDLYRRTAAALGQDAANGAILGAALIANFGLPAGSGNDLQSAAAIQVETNGFSRLIVAPYRLQDGAQAIVEWDKVAPQPTSPLIFVNQ